MTYTDLHTHILFGVDDGAKTEADMFAIVDALHKEGCSTLCMTPHFHPGFFGNNSAKTEKAFQTLQGYVQEHYPQMQLYLGNELRYSENCLSWLEDGLCRTLNGSRYVLVDFLADEEKRTILRGMDQLLNAGYVPVLAHGERYEKLHMDLREIRELRERGVVIQVDGGSLFGAFGFMDRLRSRKLVKQHLADVISSDTHNLVRRPSVMAKSWELVSKQQSPEYARALCLSNAERILSNKAIRKG